ncbi:MAG: Cbr-pqn-75 [Puniceicoccaceae bacterium 5H]|nr:MAG: Cbr-pqn-75 [Puniceicoccaceae bacterium 5H]
MTNRSITRNLMVAALLGGSCSLSAASNLVSNSPFLPQGFNPDSAPAPTVERPQVSSSQLEFQGVYQLNGEYHFLIFNKMDRSSNWVTLNDVEAPFQVSHYNDRQNEIEVNGQRLSLIKLPNATGSPVDPLAAAREQRRSDAALARAQAEASTTKTVGRSNIRRRVIPPAPPSKPPSTPPPNFTPPPPPSYNPGSPPDEALADNGNNSGENSGMPDAPGEAPSDSPTSGPPSDSGSNGNTSGGNGRDDGPPWGLTPPTGAPPSPPPTYTPPGRQ